MKNLSIYFCLLMLVSISANAQMSMFPNSGVHGQTLQTTITGAGIFIQANTPSGNIYEIKLTKGLDVIPIFDYNNGAWWGITEVLDANTVLTEVIIPPTVSAGTYDLEITTGDVFYPPWNQVFYSEPAAFTVLPPDGYITGTVFDDSNNNGIKDVGESGISGRYVKIIPLNYTLSSDANGDYSIPVANGSYSVIILNNSTDYFFSTNQDTIPVTINNNNSAGNDFGLRSALISVTPNTGQVGSAMMHQFVANQPIFIPGGNPYGNVNGVRVYTYPNNIILNAQTNVTVIDSFTVNIFIPISGNTTVADSLDISISTTNSPYGGSHFLRKKFNIDPPDGFIQGTVYYDNNKNGIQDVGESNIQYSQLQILPGNISFTADINGNYTAGSSNGNHTLLANNSFYDYMFVTTGPDSIPFTINNNTVTQNVGLATAMYAITPNLGYRGVTTLHQIVADRPIFITGPNSYGNINSMTIYSSPSINVTLSNITVIDSFTVQVSVYIPLNTILAPNLDLRIYTSSGFAGYHYLKDQFNIENPPYAIAGKAFFDVNQNKLLDSGEPGINGEKITLTPDNTSIFSDVSGNYLFGSIGGLQIITPDQNVPGLILFTDSASYTLNVTANVPGKDFGFISTLPDYSISTANPSLFARCNSQQYVKFTVKNTSNIAYDAVVWLKASSNMNYSSSLIPPDLISNDTLYWNISNLTPYAEINFNVLYNLPAGGSVSFNAKATSYDGSGVPQLSSNTPYSTSIFCAWDPNDKQVTPPGVSAMNFTLFTDTLQYLIRFQNTGNDTAFKVVILDTLDNDLDYNTFEVIGSSHSLLTELKSNGAVKFTFENILLPDSNINEPASHGYILYSIRPENNLPDSTTVNNTAYIFFDFNPAVVTNTTLNTLVHVIPTGVAEAENSMNVIVYPNPFSQSATLMFENPNSDTYKLDVITIDGKSAMTVQFTTTDKIVIEKNKLSQGIYFYHLTNTSTHQERVGKIIVE